MKQDLRGVIPEEPYCNSRVVTFKLTPELHKRLKLAAVERDASVSAVVKAGIELFLSSHPA